MANSNARLLFFTFAGLGTVPGSLACGTSRQDKGDVVLRTQVGAEFLNICDYPPIEVGQGGCLFRAQLFFHELTKSVNAVLLAVTIRRFGKAIGICHKRVPRLEIDTDFLE